MFRHVVMFTFKDGTSAAQIQEVIDGLSTLPAAIKEIRSYAFGRDAGVNPGNYGLCVVGEFDSRDDYLVYRDNPAHTSVIASAIAPIVDRRAAVQLESVA